LRSARRVFGLEQANRVLLVLGGSQGSARVDAIAPQVAAAVSKILPDFGVIHLANEAGKERVEREYRSAGVQASVHGFFRDMNAAYSAVDVALCRAGGTTIAELAVYGIPMVLIPYPHATDDHQRANARAVEVEGAGFMADENGLDVARLIQLVSRILTDTKCLAFMSACAQRLGRPAAAAAVADMLVELGVGGNCAVSLSP
jgi:UDP-N-acetylglucosamine--N-acetylmuramyl-(pentapeptide) pyrophosphoryl-undecaprenol N-acetylglucosamine transferase